MPWSASYIGDAYAVAQQLEQDAEKSVLTDPDERTLADSAKTAILRCLKLQHPGTIVQAKVSGSLILKGTMKDGKPENQRVFAMELSVQVIFDFIPALED